MPSEDSPRQTDYVSPEDDRDSESGGFNRRHFLRSAGVVAGGVATTGPGAVAVTAATAGYGAGGYGEGGYGDPTTDVVVSVLTGSPTNVEKTSATLTGELLELTGADTATCYFQWRVVGSSTWTDTSSTTLDEGGPFSRTIDGLSSGTDYEYRAVAEAGDDAEDTDATVTFITDSATHAPVVETFSVSEAGKPNPHAEIVAEWAVSDEDGDLRRVEIEVRETDGDTNATVVDSSVHWVTGGAAAGTDSFKIKHVGSQTFTVSITVSDGAGNDDFESTSVSS